MLWMQRIDHQLPMLYHPILPRLRLDKATNNSLSSVLITSRIASLTGRISRLPRRRLILTMPLLPLHDKALTCNDAANLLRGIAELLDVYPADGVLLTLTLDAIGPSTATTRSAKSAKRSTTAKP